MVAQQDPSECSQCALCPGSSLDHLGHQWSCPGSSLDHLGHQWLCPGSSLDRLGHNVVMPRKLIGPPRPSRGHAQEVHWTASAIMWSCPGSSLDRLGHHVVMPWKLLGHHMVMTWKLTGLPQPSCGHGCSLQHAQGYSC